MLSEDADEETKTHGRLWDERVRRGEPANMAYFRAKWGCPEDFTQDNWRQTCLNRTPFNRSALDLPWWKLDERRRGCIDGFHTNCTYDTLLVPN